MTDEEYKEALDLSIIHFIAHRWLGEKFFLFGKESLTVEEYEFIKNVNLPVPESVSSNPNFRKAVKGQLKMMDKLKEKWGVK